MKMLPGHLDELRSLVVPLDTPERRALYAAGKFKNADTCSDLDKRYRWDLAYAMPDRGSVFRKLYMYLNDTHIDTALKAIVPPLNRGGEQGVSRGYLSQVGSIPKKSDRADRAFSTVRAGQRAGFSFARRQRLHLF